MRREKARRTVPCVRVEGFLLGVDAKVLKVALVDCDLVRLHRVRVSWLSVRDPPSPPRPPRHSLTLAEGLPGSLGLATMGDYEVTQYPSLLRPSISLPRSLASPLTDPHPPRHLSLTLPTLTMTYRERAHGPRTGAHSLTLLPSSELTRTTGQLFCPIDVAHATVEALGELERIQFKDVSVTR